MPNVKGLDAVMIYANNPAKLGRWYEESLGIKLTQGPDGWYTGAIPGTRIHFGIHAAPKKLGSGGRAVMVNYRVGNLKGFIAALTKKGVRINRLPDEPYGKFAHSRDPEGNLIEIWQPTPQRKRKSGGKRV